MVTPESFRAAFRAFADSGQYSDGTIEYWVTVATGFLDPNRWGTSLDYGVGLFAAHHMVLDARDVQVTTAGGVPGDVNGPATAKQIDKVSKSMDTKAVTIENADFWNMTTYGIRFMRLAKQFGAGGIQLGTTPPPGGPFLIFPPGFGV